MLCFFRTPWKCSAVFEILSVNRYFVVVYLDVSDFLHAVSYLVCPHSSALEANIVYRLGALACGVSGSSSLFVSVFVPACYCEINTS